jgi:hypothetical protein
MAMEQVYLDEGLNEKLDRVSIALMKIDLPEASKTKLKEMSIEQGFSMNQLVVGALRSIIKEYDINGYRMFASLVVAKDQIKIIKKSLCQQSIGN